MTKIMNQSIRDERVESVAFRKILKSILSCTTVDQIDSCRKMVDNYKDVYDVYNGVYSTVMKDRCNTLRGYIRIRLKSIRGDYD